MMIKDAYPWKLNHENQIHLMRKCRHIKIEQVQGIRWLIQKQKTCDLATSFIEPLRDGYNGQSAQHIFKAFSWNNAIILITSSIKFVLMFPNIN